MKRATEEASVEMSEVSLRQRIVVLVPAALLSLAVVFAASAVAPDEAYTYEVNVDATFLLDDYS